MLTIFGCIYVMYEPLIVTGLQVMLPPSGDLLQVLSADPKFSRFAAALKEANFAEKLQLGGPYTVFAPSNQVSRLIICLKVF